jgi:hypothetical protein
MSPEWQAESVENSDCAEISQMLTALIKSLSTRH